MLKMGLVLSLCYQITFVVQELSNLEINKLSAIVVKKDSKITAHKVHLTKVAEESIRQQGIANQLLIENT